MERLEAAILRTVLYADVFDFPMTVAEIHHFLIHDEPVSRSQIEHTFTTSDWLKERLEIHDGYVTCFGRGHLAATRIAREDASRHLWPLAYRYGKWLSRLPFVRMVALTGALAMRNAADSNDDLDYLLVTAAHRVWLARAFSILLVRLARLQGIEICPNYVVAENALEQEQRDIFIAHEVTQMVPLYGHSLYYQMREINSWVTGHLSNAQGVFYTEGECIPGTGWSVLKRLLESLLTGPLGDRLENWEYRRKLRRFARDMAIPYSAAKLDDSQIKGHFNDHGYYILAQYAERIRQWGLEQTMVNAPGD